MPPQLIPDTRMSSQGHAHTTHIISTLPDSLTGSVFCGKGRRQEKGRDRVGAELSSHLPPPGSALAGTQRPVPPSWPRLFRAPFRVTRRLHARPGTYGSHRGPRRAWRNSALVEHACYRGGCMGRGSWGRAPGGARDRGHVAPLLAGRSPLLFTGSALLILPLPSQRSC